VEPASTELPNFEERKTKEKEAKRQEFFWH
jgi:hypothetical protein